jgi:4-hydroxy-3-polyprenylbenzoate decarboxylase
MHQPVPFGTDELGYSGALQGTAIELVKGVTVDGYAIANAEIVLEGYLDTGSTVWESEAASKAGEWDKAPFFPEYTGYMGGAVKTLKFEITAITHRKNPIFYAPLAHSQEGDFLLTPGRAASIYKLCEDMVPGLTSDVYILPGQKGLLGCVIQVKKDRPRYEGFQKNLMNVILELPEGPQCLILVDDDVECHSAEDVIWAITTRCNPATGVYNPVGMRKRQGNPIEELSEQSGLQGVLGLDCTVPFDKKWAFKQGHYPIEKVKLEDYLSAADVAKAKSVMSEYAQVIAKRGS